jgi:hypothetical protein
MAFEDPIIGGNGELIREEIKSPDYVAGVSGWSVRRDGTAEFNNVNVRLDLNTSTITVGAAGGPQVVLRVDTGVAGSDAGVIEFPTNIEQEIQKAYLRSSFSGIGAARSILLTLQSAATNQGDTAKLQLQSGRDDGTVTPSALLGGVLTKMLIQDQDRFEFQYSPVEMEDELTLGTIKDDVNNPVRLAKGKVFSGTTPTTINLAATQITDADCPNVYLEAGYAYEVAVVITMRSSAGTSAAGTQHLGWSLWQTAVGGTQKGVEVRNFKPGVGTAQAETEIKFTFEQTVDFTGTLVLSARKIAGGDTVEAIVNARYSMKVFKQGNPVQITGM